ncbi:ABC transporter substrate-binding protein [Falsochrobactrum sp. TDYN1]|uniref:ABC transporter substrate-binding protein n=2 Tax=Falsochrobactrum tianjinense TaxID=2706015 RepID=A0A949PM59_9HYPH|nr:ABC transporter substrate-binding protein [Falsochrobactrum sp. TDYN1]
MKCLKKTGRVIEPEQFLKPYGAFFRPKLRGNNYLKYFSASFSALALLCLAIATPARSQDIRIGFAAPLSGGFALLGKQLGDGAQVAASVKNVSLTIADDQCNAEGGKAVAENFIREGVQIAAGFLCSEALEAALPVLNQNNIPVIASGISNLTLTERRSTAPMPIFHLTTGLEKEMHATGSFLASLWRSQPFAIIDDGTIEGRERAARLVAQLKEQQLQPVFTDTYRPGLENQNALVARLRRAGATHVYVGGERDDIAAIGASAHTLKYSLVIAGGSVLKAAPSPQPLSEGTLMIAPLNPQDLPTAKPAIDALRKADSLVGAYSITGYATVELAAEALKQAQEQNRTVQNILSDSSFETVLGTIKFDANGMRTDNPNRLQRYEGKHFIPADR